MRRPVFPAYGRELMRRRQGGDHPDPAELVLVALNFWPWPGEGRRKWPAGRFVVVTDEMPLARLELRMLAGTSPLIAFDNSRVTRARELALLVARVEPFEGWVHVLEYDLGVFASMRAPDEWVERTWPDVDYWTPLAADLAAMASVERPPAHLHVEALERKFKERVEALVLEHKNRSHGNDRRAA
jgi:hypothetical protein